MITFKQWLIQTGQMPDEELRKRPKTAEEQQAYEALVENVSKRLYEAFHDYGQMDAHKE